MVWRSEMKKQHTDDETLPVNHNSAPILMEFIETIESLEEAKSNIADDIKDVYAEVKGVGFDVKVVRKVIKRRKIDREKLQEEDYLLDTYEKAVEDFESMLE